LEYDSKFKYLFVTSRYIVWGSSLCKHYQFDLQTNILNHPTLLHQPNVNTLFNVLDDNQLLDSAYNFPLYRRWFIAFVLDTLRNSLSHGGGSVLGGGSRKAKSFHISIDSGGRLTKIHANFFIRVLKILSQPENHMFQPIWNCLLAKPAIDLRYVPEFLRLFFSTNNKFTIERQWIVRLCVDSLGDPADYLVMENSLVFKHILCAYSLPSADMSFKFSVLRLLVNATKHSRIVHALIRFHAILLWLSRHATASISSEEQRKLFLCILENIHNALAEKSSNQPIMDIVNLIKDECS
ncbi:unnamed protein product, partial [Schistosoma mattheei]